MDKWMVVKIVTLLPLFFQIGIASASQTPCREISKPTVISESGCIRVTADIEALDQGESAILVAADNVSIDLGGHTLRGQGTGSVSAGIHVLGADNTSIRNGTVTGFLYGIRVEPRMQDQVDNISIERVFAIQNSARGIYVNAQRAALRNNVVKTLTGYEGWPEANTIAIEIVAPECQIIGNIIAEIYSGRTNNAIGIALASISKKCEIHENLLTNSRPSSGRAVAFWLGAGLAVQNSESIRISENTSTGFDYAFMAPASSRQFFRGNYFSADCSSKDGRVMPTAIDADFVSAEELTCLNLTSDVTNVDFTEPCRHINAPVKISQSGCYRITSDFSVSELGQPAITINADRVNLDLAGHTIRGQGPASIAAGIHIQGGSEITIRNGTLSGFLFGIRAEPQSDKPLENLLVEQIAVVDGSARGIFAQAKSVVLRNNIVRNLIGYTGWTGSHSIGIEIVAQYCKITGNLVSEIYPEGVGESVGISLTEEVVDCLVAENVVANAIPPEFGRSIGFWVGSDQKRQSRGALRVTGNKIYGLTYAFMAAPGAAYIQENIFWVNCTSANVAGYNTYMATNQFFATKQSCNDTPQRLKILAQSGNTNWSIRLAASYIEQQWHWKNEKRSIKNICNYYRRAEKILKPLASAKNVAASEQMKRLKVHMAMCQ